MLGTGVVITTGSVTLNGTRTRSRYAALLMLLSPLLLLSPPSLHQRLVRQNQLLACYTRNASQAKVWYTQTSSAKQPIHALMLGRCECYDHPHCARLYEGTKTLCIADPVRTASIPTLGSILCAYVASGKKMESIRTPFSTTDTYLLNKCLGGIRLS